MKIYTATEFCDSFYGIDGQLVDAVLQALPFKTTIVVNNIIWPSDVRSKKIDEWLEKQMPRRASRIVNDVVCFENKSDAMMYILKWS